MQFADERAYLFSSLGPALSVFDVRMTADSPTPACIFFYSPLFFPIISLVLSLSNGVHRILSYSRSEFEAFASGAGFLSDGVAS